MSTAVHPNPATMQSASSLREVKPNVDKWESLCGWLTQELRGIMTTVERREGDGDWVVECLSSPMESVTTRVTSNGIRVLSVSICMNGHRKLFEISGPNSIGLRRNAAGWPLRVDLGYEEGRLALIFSGQMDPQRRSSSNGWGE
jgi:hypothetical protein